MEKRTIDNDELLLKEFFAAHSETIADNGFTERVMRGLPESKPQLDWLPPIWNAVMMTLALVLFIVLGGVDVVKSALYQYLDAALTRGVDMRVVFALMCAFVVYISHKAIKRA